MDKQQKIIIFFLIFLVVVFSGMFIYESGLVYYFMNQHNYKVEKSDNFCLPVGDSKYYENCSSLIGDVLIQDVKDVGICNKFSDSGNASFTYYNLCMNRYFSENERTFEECKLITHTGAMNNCYNQMASKNLSYEACQMMKSNNKFQMAGCLRVVGRGLKSKEVCDMIEVGSYRASCYLDIGFEVNKDIELCFLMTDDKEKDFCISSAASYLYQGASDVGICNKIPMDLSESLHYYNLCMNAYFRTHNYAIDECTLLKMDKARENCFSQTAANNLDPKACQMKSNEIYVRNCLYSIAEKTRNKEVCDMIDSESRKAECYKNIGFNIQ